ncbi:MAG TPA: hypothetical protein VIG41_09460 [Micrococcaceae bacterium]
MPNLNAGKGADVAEATQTGRRSSSRLDQVRFKNNELVVFRLVTKPEDFFTADVHRFLPVLTKPPADMVENAAKNKKEVNWPSGMWAVCQDDRIYLNTGPDGEPIKGSYEDGYGQCRIKTIFKGQQDEYKNDRTKPSRLTYGVVVLQDARYEGKHLRALNDRMEEWTDQDGTKYQVPAVRYMAQLYRNVWSPLIMGAAADMENPDPCGRSFMIRRQDTAYSVSLVPGLRASAEQTDAAEKTLELMGFDLDTFMLDHGTTEHYDRFWGDGTGTPAPSRNGSAGQAAAPDSASGHELSPEAETNLAKFGEMLAANARNAGSEPEPSSAPAG